MKSILKILSICGLVGALAAQAQAIPTVQVYIDGATAGSMGGDQDTWFSTGNSFDLNVVGAYGSNTQSLTMGTLVFSVPQSQTGTISISSSDGDEFLLATTANQIGTGNPLTAANLDILTDVGGNDGYADKASFLPADATFNNHYPFQDGISDFILFDIDAFFTGEGPLHDYNASDGTTDIAANSDGEEKTYQISFTGFTQMHIDAYMLETDLLGQSRIATSWEINPGSHDSTAIGEPDGPEPIPAPGAFLLGIMGMGMIGAVRRRFS